MPAGATFSFLKITTDDGLVGWSEYNESYGSAGLTAVIAAWRRASSATIRGRSSGS